MQGGLKMINIYKFVKGLHISWVKKLLNNSDKPQWQILFENTYCKVENLVKKGKHHQCILGGSIKFLETTMQRARN